MTRTYWRSLAQLEEHPESRAFLEREFPEGASELPEGITRRDMMMLLGASLSLAGLAGCRRPVEEIVPYVTAPEEIVPGVPRYYATTMPFRRSAYGLIVESHEGRPTKIEGNPGHPATLGASSARIQASVLGLYDPDRSQTVRLKGEAKSWNDFVTAWGQLSKAHAADGGAGLAVLSESFSSPTLARLTSELRARFPRATWATYEAVSDENRLAGLRSVTGRDLDLMLRDCLLPGGRRRPRRSARGRRRRRSGWRLGSSRFDGDGEGDGATGADRGPETEVVDRSAPRRGVAQARDHARRPSSTAKIAAATGANSSMPWNATTPASLRSTRSENFAKMPPIGVSSPAPTSIWMRSPLATKMPPGAALPSTTAAKATAPRALIAGGPNAAKATPAGAASPWATTFRSVPPRADQDGVQRLAAAPDRRQEHDVAPRIDAGSRDQRARSTASREPGFRWCDRAEPAGRPGEDALDGLADRTPRRRRRRPRSSGPGSGACRIQTAVRPRNAVAFPGQP